MPERGITEGTLSSTSGTDRGVAFGHLQHQFRRFADAVLAMREWGLSDFRHLVGVALCGHSGLYLPDDDEGLETAHNILGATAEPLTLGTYVRVTNAVFEAGDLVRDKADQLAAGDALAQLDGLHLLCGGAAGFGSSIAPIVFLPEDCLPEITGLTRRGLSSWLYFARLWIEGDARRWFDHALGTAVGARCSAEIQARWTRYPNSAQVYRAVAEDSSQAFRSLFRKVGSSRYRGSEEAMSALGLLLAEEVAKSGPLGLACDSLDGKYEQIGASLRRDLINEYEKTQTASRRPKGGVWQLREGRYAGDGFMKPEDVMGSSREAGGRARIPWPDLVDGPILQLSLERLAKSSHGRVARLAEHVLRNPDWTLRERAEGLQVTEKTLYNWRKELAESVKPTDE